MSSELMEMACRQPKFITLGHIPQRDQEKITLTVLFFWLKYMRRNALQPNFQPTPPRAPDPGNPFSIIGIAWEMKQGENGDATGDAASGIARLVKNHPARTKLFGLLSDEEIGSICFELDGLFENEEWCAFCECWSHYDNPDAEDFAFGNAIDMLYIMPFWEDRHHALLPWYCQINDLEIRKVIVLAVLKNVMAKAGGQAKVLLQLENLKGSCE